MDKKIIFISLICTFVTGCVDTKSLLESARTFKSIVDNIDTTGMKVSEGAVRGLTGNPSKSRLDSLVAQLTTTLMQTARETILNNRTKQKLDSIVVGLVTAVRDTLTDQQTKKKLDALISSLSATTRAEASQLVKDVLGEKTGKLIQERISKDVLGDSTIVRLGVARDTLLGAKTQQRLESIIDGALTKFDKHAETNLGLLQKNAWEILLGIAGLSVGVIAFFWWEKYHYRKILAGLTHQIHRIPDQEVYDELSKRIQQNMIHSGVEARLRKILVEEGIN